jgi:hypothetical protein
MEFTKANSMAMRHFSTMTVWGLRFHATTQPKTRPWHTIRFNTMMTPERKLLTIKVIHTAIWFLFVVVIFYVLYSGISDNINSYTWIGIALVIGEGLTLLLFKMFCPLTLMARRYSDSQKDNFDIFLPNWLAKHNKLIFTSLFIVALVSVLYRTFQI